MRAPATPRVAARSLAFALVWASACGSVPRPLPPTGPVEPIEHAPAQPAQRPSTPKSGQAAPALDLLNIEGGGRFSLGSRVDPTGQSSPRAVLVAFMASWCQYCSNSLPTLVELEKANPDLEIVAVTVDDRPELQQAELLKVRKAGLTGPVLAADATVIQTWVGGGKSVPKYYFINHNGLIVAHDDGFGDKVEPLMPKQVARALED